jgi:hypothetical protein
MRGRKEGVKNLNMPSSITMSMCLTKHHAMNLWRVKEVYISVLGNRESTISRRL